MKKSFWLFIYAGYIFCSNTIDASPVFLQFKKSQSDLYKKIANCTKHTESPSFQFQPENFLETNHLATTENMENSALKSSNERVDSLICINSAKISTEEKEEIRLMFESGFFRQKEFLEIYKRWLFSFRQINKVSPIEEKEIEKFFEAKHDLYHILYDKTNDWLFQKINEKEKIEALKEFYFIYSSLIKLHFEFYNSLSIELRNIILDKIK